MARENLKENDECEVDRDLDSDEEDEEEVEVNDNLNAFRPQHILEQHSWTRRTIAQLVDMMNTPWLILDPEYQRNVVWTNDRMTRLINSLMSNFYIPPLIFNVKKVPSIDGKGDKFQRICIDGKQRLSSIKEFVAGRIPCIDSHRQRWYFTPGDGKAKRRVLSEAAKEHFRSLEVLCVEYQELERFEEEDLFARVQMGVELRPAEKLRARTGLWQAFAIEMEQKYPDLLSLIENNRARGFQTILSTYKILLSEDDVPKYSTGAASLQPFLDKDQLLDDKFKKVAHRVFSVFNEVHKKHPTIFADNNYKHSKKFAPIEFVGVALLIHRYPERSIGLLAGDIKGMREVLRAERQELRSNSSTFRAVVNYIENLEQYRGGQGVLSSREDIMDEDEDEEPERKPKVINGTAVVSTPRSKGNTTTRVLPLGQTAAPPPSTTVRRASITSNSPRNNTSTSAAKREAAQRQYAANVTFAPPTAPLADREREQRERQRQARQQKRQQEPPAMVPVAPMSRYNGHQDPSVKLRPTNYGQTLQSPVTASSSSFKAINAPSPFLPDIDTDPINSPMSPPYSRKRQRREEEDDLDDLSLDNPGRRHSGSGIRYRAPPDDDDADFFVSSFNQVRGGGNYGSRSGSGFGSRAGRTGGIPTGPAATRRAKHERNHSGSRKEITYGPFTVEE